MRKQLRKIIEKLAVEFGCIETAHEIYEDKESELQSFIFQLQKTLDFYRFRNSAHIPKVSSNIMDFNEATIRSEP